MKCPCWGAPIGHSSATNLFTVIATLANAAVSLPPPSGKCRNGGREPKSPQPSSTVNCSLKPLRPVHPIGAFLCASGASTRNYCPGLGGFTRQSHRKGVGWGFGQTTSCPYLHRHRLQAVGAEIDVSTIPEQSILPVGLHQQCLSRCLNCRKHGRNCVRRAVGWPAMQ